MLKILNMLFKNGGCWGDIVNDNNFCQNGLVGPDRSVQFEVHEEVQNVTEAEHTEKISYADRKKITLLGDNFELRFNKLTGLIEEYQYNGTTLITNGPTPNYWRGTYDNDRSENSINVDARTWENANDGMKVELLNCFISDDRKIF